MRSRIALGMVVTVASLELFVACGNTAFTSAGGPTGDGSADTTSFADVDFPEVSPSGDGGGGYACPNSGRGPDMIALSNGQCIDSTEVTLGQYQEFVSTSSGYSAGDPRCPSPPGSYSRDTDCLMRLPPDAVMNLAFPATCVTWCDALTFCNWAGKRLCGAIDGGVRTEGQQAQSDSQWEFACTAGGAHDFPYGQLEDAPACNIVIDGGDASLASLAAPKSFPGCVGGFAGIYDMAGNASEWVDYCDTKDSGLSNNECAKMGSSYKNDPSATGGNCKGIDYEARGTTGVDVGFRCCAP